MTLPTIKTSEVRSLPALQASPSGSSEETAPVARLQGQGSDSKSDAAGIDTRERRASMVLGRKTPGRLDVLDQSRAIRSGGSEGPTSATREIETRRVPACDTAGLFSLSGWAIPTQREQARRRQCVELPRWRRAWRFLTWSFAR